MDNRYIRDICLERVLEDSKDEYDPAVRRLQMTELLRKICDNCQFNLQFSTF